MIVDTSALIAVLRAEPEREQLLVALSTPGEHRVAAPTLVEAGLVAGPFTPELMTLVDRLGLAVEPFTVEHAVIAHEAHRRFGRGSGSPARLNFGDCLSYALARVTGEPLLFKGGDFRHTDVTPAV